MIREGLVAHNDVHVVPRALVHEHRARHAAAVRSALREVAGQGRHVKAEVLAPEACEDLVANDIPIQDRVHSSKKVRLQLRPPGPAGEAPPEARGGAAGARVRGQGDFLDRRQLGASDFATRPAFHKWPLASTAQHHACGSRNIYLGRDVLSCSFPSGGTDTDAGTSPRIRVARCAPRQGLVTHGNTQLEFEIIFATPQPVIAAVNLGGGFVADDHPILAQDRRPLPLLRAPLVEGIVPPAALGRAALRPPLRPRCQDRLVLHLRRPRRGRAGGHIVAAACLHASFRGLTTRDPPSPSRRGARQLLPHRARGLAHDVPPNPVDL
mmetsp:Transcript_62594/g.159150  ORF Transcript_62594/g.159150 Transcript_62594/m.159150 type:complete len:324 (+) Transcript_62594:476-1447(+)